MSMPKAPRQMPARAGRAGAARDEVAHQPVSDEADGPRHEPNDTGNPHAALLHAALTRENLRRALKRVRANKGAAGVGGLDIDQTARHLMTAWPAIREQLLAGTYRPSPVRRVLIPKPDGGQRELGIPTVVDRLIKPWKLGAKNWLFVGGELSLAGQFAAMVMSLVQSAKLNRIDPWAYLRDVLARIHAHPNHRIDELLSHRWRAS